MSSDYVLQLINVSKAYGHNTVLDDISLSFIRGARIGVIGANGGGKTTILRVLAGVETEFEGRRLIVPDNTSIGYLAQEPELTPGTVGDNLDEGVADIHKLLTRFDELNMKLGEDLTPDAMQSVMDEHATVSSAIEHKDAWTIDSRVEQAAHALGVPPRESDVSKLSGGERRRVALCKMFLQHPDVLLLDEPTNHLDADAVFWLERHLAEYDGTVISITHDRYFLDNVAQWMLEMEGGRAYPFEGNYSSYLEQRAKRINEADSRAKARKRRLDHELEWIRSNPKGRQAKSKARVKSFDELYDQHKSWSEQNRDPMAIIIPTVRKLGSKVLNVEGITKTFGDRTVLEDITFELPPGAVMGVIGPNGTGKTTLLKIISGQIKADKGTIEMGTTVVPCYVDQDRANLDPTKTVWEEITAGGDEVQLGKISVNSRAYVSKFNFKGTDQQQLVGNLSGGQRNRVQLAKMLKEGGNLLLVDEPTNDLDITTIRVLEEALQHYAGSAIIVSHDRYFLDRLCTHILSFEDGGHGRFWEGNYSAYKVRIDEEREAKGIKDTKGKHRRFS